ncbi:ethanolamine ammonia-lyase [Suicoccus acidiformans]|uniref:Ethanolamine ammonia-lyase small subunit n=1 Tax=Suicoccus acidiformans TaxID=2036206 RepID=A0A347WLZ1_9LACT|nr:ethanolamine ammonia-lyase subunit EutC [Suicoccus acidiformans]AXY26098.1 ethanolamine ammonia-lyase [Suicoccus acidiformans]
MEQTELKQMIRAILTEMASGNNDEITEDASGLQTNSKETIQVSERVTYHPAGSTNETEQVKQNSVSDEVLDDITELNIRETFYVDNAEDEEGYMRIKQHTPARLGMGRAGSRYKTQPVLRFRADHAAAQDAVYSYVDEELIKDLNLVPLETVCQDKDEYLKRPDLGRVFSEESAKKIKEVVPQNADVVVVVGDGLSSAAIEANVRDILPAIRQGLKTHNLDFGDVLFVKHCRVPAMDQIGDITNANVICMLIGERPGLVTAESMSAYIAYRPTVGMPEAGRTVISNIHDGGTPAVEAGAYIADIIEQILKQKASGTSLEQ